MISLGHLIVRLVPIFLGLVLAFLAAGVFIGYGFYAGVIDPAFDIDPHLRGDSLIVLLTGAVWSPFIAAVALGPALIIIAMAEFLKMRSLIANLVAGALASLFVFWAEFDTSTVTGLTEGPLLVVLATGFIGAFAYWLVAGRNAGKWLERPGSVR